MSKSWFPGLTELDQMFGNGVQKGSAILFLYETGSGQDYITSEIIRNHYNRGGKTILVLTSNSSSHFVNNIQDILSSENFKIIDCVSPKNIYNTKHYIPNTSQIFDIFLEMKKARDDFLKNPKEEEPNILVCFYSLSSLFINFETNEVIQFLDKNIREAMRCKTIEFYLLSEGILEKSVEKRIQTLANVILRTRTEFKEHRRQNYIQLLEHNSETPYPEERQYSIISHDYTRPKLVFHIPLLGGSYMTNAKTQVNPENRVNIH
ncbi:MAG: hypothetical protein Q6366_009330 [Candidatus Freyarchaeota archaeon]